MDEFATAFYQSDYLLVTDIYAAGEEPIPGVDAEVLTRGIVGHGHKTPIMSLLRRNCWRNSWR